MAGAMSATLTGGTKIKILIYSFFNVYFGPRAFTNSKDASTPLPYLSWAH